MSAAAAFAVQLALSWISKSSDSKTSKKDNTKTIKTDSEEKVQTITSSEYPTCESDPITKTTPNMSQPLTSSKVEVNISKTKNNIVKSHKEEIVFGQRSWSDIIEDEDSSTKIVSIILNCSRFSLYPMRVADTCVRTHIFYIFRLWLQQKSAE